MPLVDITLKPGYCIKVLRQGWSHTPHATGDIVKGQFAHAIPHLFVEHAKKLRLSADTPAEGIQVMRHDYDEGDVNIANVWVKVQFSERHAWWWRRKRIRNRLYSILTGWFREYGFELEDFVLDIFWGPTNGKGTVNGVEIEW